MIYSLSLKSGEFCAAGGDEQKELLTTSQFQSRIEPSSVPMPCMWILPKYVKMFSVVDNKQFQLIMLPRLHR